jgi:hypothetical protein
MHAGRLGLTGAVIDSRLQRLLLAIDFPGALPQAENEERAPLALNRYARPPYRLRRQDRRERHLAVDGLLENFLNGSSDF